MSPGHHDRGGDAVTVAAVVLAAGAGRRFTASGGRGPKQLATVGGGPLVARALAAARDAAVDEVVLVQGSVDLSAHAADVTLLDNPGWAGGLATSLAVAVDHARAAGHDAVVVGLADQPGIPAAAWTAVATAPPVPPIAIATYAGRRRHPVRLHEAVWDLLPTTGDEGAGRLLRDRPDLVAEIPCAGDPRDVDTREDLDAWT